MTATNGEMDYGNINYELETRIIESRNWIESIEIWRRGQEHSCRTDYELRYVLVNLNVCTTKAEEALGGGYLVLYLPQCAALHQKMDALMSEPFVRSTGV